MPRIATPLDAAPPGSWAMKLSPGHVRTRETQQLLTDKVSMGFRKALAASSKWPSSSPARWNHGQLMYACQFFKLNPVLGKGGTAYVKRSLGIDPGAAYKEAEPAAVEATSEAPVSDLAKKLQPIFDRWNTQPHRHSAFIYPYKIGERYETAYSECYSCGTGELGMMLVDVDGSRAAFLCDECHHAFEDEKSFILGLDEEEDEESPSPSATTATEESEVPNVSVPASLATTMRRPGYTALQNAVAAGGGSPSLKDLFGESEPEIHVRDVASAPLEKLKMDLPEGIPAGVFVDVYEDPHFHISPSQQKFIEGLERRSRRGPVNACFRGPTGAGKTSMAFYLAAKYERPLVVIDCAAIREPQDWFGYRTIRIDADGNQTIEWVTSSMVHGIEVDNAIVLYDEINRVHASVANPLFPLWDFRRSLYFDPLGRRVSVGRHTIILATANIGTNYSGTYGLDDAFENRFNYNMEVGYLPPDKEKALLVSKTGIDPKVAERFVEVAGLIRRQTTDANQPLPKGVSPRQLMDASFAVVDGLTPIEAMEFTIVPTYSPEGGNDSDRATVLKIIQGKLAA